MTAMIFGRRIRMRAVGLGCWFLAFVPATAFGQAQSVPCAKASMFHAAHNNKEAAKWDNLCRISSIKAGTGGGAAAQEAARNERVARAREVILAKQRADAAQRPAPQPQAAQVYPQSSYAARSASPSQPQRQSVGSILARLQADRARRQFLMQQQQQQQQMQAQAPAATPLPMPAAPMPSAPPPTALVVPVSDNSATPADSLETVLTPGPRDTSLANDQTVAARAKTDLGVFGVALADPLTRPRCARGAHSPDPCIAENGFPTLVAALFNERIAKLSDFSNVPLHLPDAQCPDWLKAGSCDVVLAMSGGYVYAAFMVVGGEEAQTVIETQLAQKYGKKADKGAASQCKKDGSRHPNAPLRSWSLRGLRVEYDPYGAGCASSQWRRGTGQLVVETDTFRRLVTEASAAAEPKM